MHNIKWRIVHLKITKYSSGIIRPLIYVVNAITATLYVILLS